MRLKKVLAVGIASALARELSKKELLESSGCSSAVLDGVLKRGVLESYEKEVGRLQIPVCRLHSLNPLSAAQEKAYGEIHDIFREKEVCLLQWKDGSLYAADRRGVEGGAPGFVFAS